jgi:hypothetical protein
LLNFRLKAVNSSELLKNRPKLKKIDPMKKIIFFLILTITVIFPWELLYAASVLRNQKIEVALDEKGNLITLKNIQTGLNYASGKQLWRLYFDNKDQKGIEIPEVDNLPVIKQEGNQISVTYVILKYAGEELNIRLSLKITLEEEWVRFSSEVTNNEPHTIVRELQFPLVSDCRMPAGHKLLTTTLGGQLFKDPKNQILEVGNNPPYMGPSQFFRQMDLKYPSVTAANCFALIGDSQGLYLGSHDTTFQETWHGLRLYPDGKGNFTELEVGLYKYPNCVYGQSWSCNANVIAAYSGDWHKTSRLYRSWADSWWKHALPPLWVQKMKSWQRIIFRHQYGETFFRYKDLSDRILKAGQSIGETTVFPFGWWNSGMDNGYPDSYFVTDPKQGGDGAWKESIADFRQKGGRLLLYFNGKLIDTESDYYRNGPGKTICCKRNSGMDYTEAYLFKAKDTFTGSFNSRSFVVADTHQPEWQKMLLTFADRALSFGADAVFYDQLGYLYGDMNWDTSKEFPVPNRNAIADRANALKMVHDYIDKKDRNFAIGTEGVTDVTARYADFIHNLPGAGTPNSFIEWFRFTFPEIIISDREIRDDTDIERRVNLTVLRGLRNDVEIYRCRDLIDKTPHYQQYLSRINQLKDKYSSLLLEGTYCDTEGFSLDNHTIDARCFTNGNRLAVVATQTNAKPVEGKVMVNGYRFIESSIVGEGKVSKGNSGEQNISLGKNGLLVLIFEK